VEVEVEKEKEKEKREKMHVMNPTASVFFPGVLPDRLMQPQQPVHGADGSVRALPVSDTQGMYFRTVVFTALQNIHQCECTLDPMYKYLLKEKYVHEQQQQNGMRHRAAPDTALLPWFEHVSSVVHMLEQLRVQLNTQIYCFGGFETHV